MKRPIKLLLLLASSGLVLLIAAVLVALTFINSLARDAIQSGGTYALGASTKLESVSIGLLQGRVSIAGLHIANPTPQGQHAFTSPHFLTLGRGGVAVSLRTLRQPTVELPHLTLKDLDIHLEKKGDQSNFGLMLDRLKQSTGGGDRSPTRPPAADEKRYIIHDLDMQNIVIRADLLGGSGAVGELTKVTVPIDRIRLTDVGKTGTGVAGTGVTMSELAGIIVKALLAAAAEKGGGIIPAELLDDLKGKLAALGDLDKLKVEITADLKAKADDLTKSAVDQGKKQVDEAIDKLKDLVPGKNKKKLPRQPADARSRYSDIRALNSSSCM